MLLGDDTIPRDISHTRTRAIDADPRFRGPEWHREIGPADRTRADIYRIAGTTLEVDTHRLGRPRARKPGQPWDWYPVCETCHDGAGGGCDVRYLGVCATSPCDDPIAEAHARARQRRMAAEAEDLAWRLRAARSTLATLAPGKCAVVGADLAVEIGAVHWSALQPADLEGSDPLVMDLREGPEDMRSDVLDHLAAVYLVRDPHEGLRPLGLILPSWKDEPAFCDRARRFCV